MKHLIFLFLSLPFISCSQKQMETKTLLFEKPDYSVSYPSNWTCISNNPKADLVLNSELNGAGDTFSENFNILKQPIGTMSAAQYDSISNFQIIKNLGPNAIVESKIVGDHSVLIYRGPFNGRNLKWKQIYYIKNETAYLLTYTAEESSFDIYSDIAESIFNSFKFK